MTPEERVLLADSCPGASGADTVSAATVELLSELRRRDDPELLLLVCQLNRGEVTEELERLIAEQSLPARVDPLTAEVLAETLDAVRATATRTVAREYSGIELRCRRVVRAFVDDCLGFVPLLHSVDEPESLTQSLAERIELPALLLEQVSGPLAPTATRVIAAQTLLQLPAHDRALLLQCPGPRPEQAPDPRSPSVAHLLSRAAALERFRTEFDHSVAWAKTCIRHPPLTLGRNQA